MHKQFLITCLLLVFSQLILFGQKKTKKSLIEKDAEIAFLKLHQILLDKDCDQLTNSFNDSIIFINVPQDTIFATWQILNSKRICEKMFQQINPQLTKKEYLKHYKVLTFSKADFLKYLHPDSSVSKGFYDYQIDTRLALTCLAYKAHQFDENDIFVVGYEPLNKKEFYQQTDNGMWIKKEKPSFAIWRFTLYMYVLRKTNKGWKIKACST